MRLRRNPKMKLIRVTVKAEVLIPDDAEILADPDPASGHLDHVKIGASWFLPSLTWDKLIRSGEWEPDYQAFEEAGGDMTVEDHSIKTIKTGVPPRSEDKGLIRR
jgi:hypothetical protein